MNYKLSHVLFFGFFLLVLFSLLHGCSSTESSKEDPDVLFTEAEEEFKDGRYLMAIEKFRDLKNRFPYSARAVDAELRIADAYFEQESYIEAETAYEVFNELHPTHPRSDYVQFRIGLSNFHQIPAHPARDLTAANKALSAFRVLQEKFPNSEFVAQAKSLSQEAQSRLAQYENYVADFYFSRRHYLSASYRYAALLKDYPKLGYDEEALYRLGECYYHVRMFGNARDAFKRLLDQFPNSSYRSASEDFVSELTPQKN